MSRSKYWEWLDRKHPCPYCGKPMGIHDESMVIDCINKWGERLKNLPEVEHSEETNKDKVRDSI